MTYFFAPMGVGLGDLLLTLPALFALIKTGVPTVLVVRSVKQEGVAETIVGLAGSIKEPDFLQLKLAKEDRFINLRDHILQTEHSFGSDKFFAKFGRLDMVDIVDRICRDLITNKLGIDGDFRTYEPLPAVPFPETEGCVILVPGSAGSYKCWGTSSWVSLYTSLKELNFPCVMLGQPDKSEEVRALQSLGLPWVATPSFANAVNAVTSARAMVSVDTGLLHLAIQQGVPSVGLYLERFSIFARPSANCFPVFAPDCHQDCLTWLDSLSTLELYFRDYDQQNLPACPQPKGSACMEQISVETVLKRLLDDALGGVDCKGYAMARALG
jgi:hypothetical protein